MSDPAPERIEIKSNRVGEFKRELHHLLQEAATGKYDAELRARGVTLPAQFLRMQSNPKSIPLRGFRPTNSSRS